MKIIGVQKVETQQAHILCASCVNMGGKGGGQCTVSVCVFLLVCVQYQSKVWTHFPTNVSKLLTGTVLCHYGVCVCVCVSVYTKGKPSSC